MIPNYETVYILKGDLTDVTAKKISDRLTEAVAKQGGRLVSFKDLGRRLLAYRIQKQLKGHYFKLDYEGGGPVVNELERMLRFTEECIRFLTVRPRRERGVPASKKEGKEKLS